MPVRENPFYRYRNPAVGYGMEGLASAMFGGQANPVQQSQITENQAQAAAAQALAGYRGEQTRGERDVNNAMTTAPSAIAELLLSGGVLQSDPMRANPDYKAPTPIDFASIFTNPAQVNQPISSPMLPGATAQDKMAAAIQEAAIRKIKLDDLLKAAGITGYQQRITGPNPDSALGFAPFAGVTSPNANTALTTGAQDRISARDAGEASSQAQAVARIQQQGAAERANNRPVSAGNNVDVILSPAQGQLLGIEPDGEGRYIVRGRSTVGTGQIQQPGSAGGETVQGRERAPAAGRAGRTPADKGPSAVPPVALKRMETKIREGLKADGINPDDNAVLGLMAAAGESWQTSKNPDLAADGVLQRLRAGEAINGVSVSKGNRTVAGVPIPGTERKGTTRAAPAASAAGSDPLAAARDAIARGAPRDAVIKRLKDNGIDPKGL